MSQRTTAAPALAAADAAITARHTLHARIRCVTDGRPVAYDAPVAPKHESGLRPAVLSEVAGVRQKARPDPAVGRPATRRGTPGTRGLRRLRRSPDRASRRSCA